MPVDHESFTDRLLQATPKFGFATSEEENFDALLKGSTSTRELVEQAQKIAQERYNNVLCAYDGVNVKTGVLLRAMLDHASKDPIPSTTPRTAPTPEITGERYTALSIVFAVDTTYADSRNSVEEVALVWFQYILLQSTP